MVELDRALTWKRHNFPIVDNDFGPEGGHDPDCIDGIDLGNFWIYYQDCGMPYASNNETIYCDVIENRRDKREIFVVNENPYDGGYSISLFSDDVNLLETFLKDLKLNHAILENTTIQSTI